MSVVKYNFKWPSGPNDVIVTGEFDEWRGTSHLKRSPDSGEFETTLPLRITEAGDRLHFKFIVDGQWTTSGFYKIGTDTAGNENNFIPKHELRSLAMKKNRGGNGTIMGKKNGAVTRHSWKEGEMRRSATPPSMRNNNHLHVSNHRHRYDHGNEGRDGYERPYTHDRTSVSNGGEVYPLPSYEASRGAANAGPIAAAEILDLFGDENESESALRKVKIKRKIKRNKKTGERIVVSEEKIPLDDESFWVSTGEEENISEGDGQTGVSNLANAAAGVASNSARQRQQPYAYTGTHPTSSVTPPSTRRSRPVSTTGIPKSSQSSGLLRNTSFTKERPTSTVGVAGSPSRPKSSNISRGTSRKKSSNVSSTSNAEEGNFHTLPMENLSGGENGTFKSLTGELGPFIPSNEEQLSAFDEVNDNVDPKAFNERLNNQYKSEDTKTSGRKIEKDHVIEKSNDDENRGKLGKESSDGKMKKKDTIDNLKKDEGNLTAASKSVGSNVKGHKATSGTRTADPNGVAVAATSNSGAGVKGTRNKSAAKVDTKDALGKLSKDDDLKQLGKDAAQGKVNKDDALKKLGKNSTVKDVGKDLGSVAANGGNGTGTAGHNSAVSSNNMRGHTGGNSGATGAGMKANKNASTTRADTKDALGKLSKDDDLKQLGKDAAQGKVNKDDALKKLGKNSTVKDVGKNLGSVAANGGNGTGTAGHNSAVSSNNMRGHTGGNSGATGTGMKANKNAGTTRADTKDALGKLSKDDDLKQLGKDAAQGKVNKDDALKKLGKNSTVKDVGKNLGSVAANGNTTTEAAGNNAATGAESNMQGHTGTAGSTSATGTGMKANKNAGTTRADTKDALGKLSKDEDLKQLGKDAAQGKVNKDDALKKLGKNSTAKDVGKNLASDVKEGATSSGGAVGLEGKGDEDQFISHDETISNDVTEDKARHAASSPNIPTNNEEVNHRNAHVTEEGANTNGKGDLAKNGTDRPASTEVSSGTIKQRSPREVTSNELQKKAVKGSESRKSRGIRPTLDPKAEDDSRGYDSTVNGRSSSRQYRDVRTSGDRENELYLDPPNGSSLGGRHAGENSAGPLNSSTNDLRTRRSTPRNAAGTATEKDGVKTGTTSPARVTGPSTAGNAANIAMRKDTGKTGKTGIPSSGGAAPTTAAKTGKVTSSPSRGPASSNGETAKTNRRSLSIPFVRRNKSVNSKGSRPKSISGAVNSERKVSKPKKDVSSKKEVNSKGGVGAPAGSPSVTAKDTEIERKENFLKQTGSGADVSGSNYSKEEASNFVGTGGSGVQNEKTRTDVSKNILEQGSAGNPNEPTTSASKEAVALESKAGADVGAPDALSPQSAAQSAATSAVNNAEKKKKFSIWAKVKRALL